jgi:hypothetical protein
MGSFLYPRTVSFYRPPAQQGEGVLSYGGQTEAADGLVVANVPASVQARREGTRNPVQLAADGNKPSWRIMTPRGAVVPGQIKDGDIAIDDLGCRYGVLADYTGSLGGDFYCERLKA